MESMINVMRRMWYMIVGRKRVNHSHTVRRKCRYITVPRG